MNIKHIDELKFPMGNGCTKPIFAVSGNEYYVVKTFNNSEGNKTLINELVCYLIALKLDIKMPESGICLIDKYTIIGKNVSDMPEFNDRCYGLGFYSQYIDKNTIISSSKMLKMARNYKEIIPQIMLFDHIVYNKDRNRGNLLITANKNNRELILIDHTHTFNLQCIWNSHDLNQKIFDNDYKDTIIMEYNEFLYSKFKEVCKIDLYELQLQVNYFRERLSRDFFRSIIDKVPEEWESDKNELIALSEYLIYRFENIDQYISIIVSYNY
ncbi:HipA family kinase [Clostridium estertheticum]|uniref:HipA family kinase n=1 Tax=Clostridium estertheticum TaxID=238834 RepID=UPI001CF5372A|nr:HipA family kinase [Clostridium estertheticum]MCB2354366.1 hypothetical protein [Clostridium estertheticum]WAG42515.1 hypothetical protein LL065_07535 [Clostridium estertheticum]